jgi:hypothetical protein
MDAANTHDSINDIVSLIIILDDETMAKTFAL